MDKYKLCFEWNKIMEAKSSGGVLWTPQKEADFTRTLYFWLRKHKIWLRGLVAVSRRYANRVQVACFIDGRRMDCRDFQAIGSFIMYGDDACFPQDNFDNDNGFCEVLQKINHGEYIVCNTP